MLLENQNEMPAAEKRESADAIILENALKFNELYVKGTNEIIKFDIQSGTYNENQGVIIGNIDGQVFALPSSPASMELIQQAELRHNEGAAVPNLNDAEYMWGSESEREGNSIFQKWKSLHQKFNK